MMHKQPDGTYVESPLHEWFGLSYASYFVMPRLALIVAGAASIIAVAIGLALIIWLAVCVVCAVHYGGSHHG